MHDHQNNAAEPQETEMQTKNSSLSPTSVPFVVGGDGHVYINGALVLSAAVTGLKLTGPVHAAYEQTLRD